MVIDEKPSLQVAQTNYQPYIPSGVGLFGFIELDVDVKNSYSTPSNIENSIEIKGINIPGGNTRKNRITS